MLHAIAIIENRTTTKEINGQWVPARPINYKILSVKQRIKDALAVFFGKADAVKWPLGQ